MRYIGKLKLEGGKIRRAHDSIHSQRNAQMRESERTSEAGRDLMTSDGKILERTKRTRTLEGETLIECLVGGFE